jgi:hypothetical protein
MTDVCKFCQMTREEFDVSNEPCSQLIYPHAFEPHSASRPLLAPELGDVWRCKAHGSPSCAVCALDEVRAAWLRSASTTNDPSPPGYREADAIGYQRGFKDALALRLAADHALVRGWLWDYQGALGPQAVMELESIVGTAAPCAGQEQTSGNDGPNAPAGGPEEAGVAVTTTTKK